MSGQAWCISGAIVSAAQWIWYTHSRRAAEARHADTQFTIWLAAAIIIGSLK